jgi:hypothetical protein
MKPRGLGPVFCAAFLLVSCSDRGQEMEEKVAQMQRQLDQAQKELQAAKQALAAHQPAPTTPVSSISTAGLPSRETVEQSYATSVAAFRKELEANLKDFRVESCTTHSVQIPAEFFPFTSQLSLALVSNDGKNFSTDIPVKADVTGKWVFPSVAEVTQRIQNAQRVASAPPPSRPTTQQSASQPPPYMKVDGTFVVQWPDSGAHAPAITARTPPPAQSQPAPAASASPSPVAAASPPPRPQPQPSAPGAQPVMPVDRDVQIQFPSPP